MSPKSQGVQKQLISRRDCNDLESKRDSTTQGEHGQESIGLKAMNIIRWRMVLQWRVFWALTKLMLKVEEHNSDYKYGVDNPKGMAKVIAKALYKSETWLRFEQHFQCYRSAMAKSGRSQVTNSEKGVQPIG